MRKTYMKNILKVHAVVACFIVSIAANAASSSDIIIKSPDTHIAFHLSLQNNQLVYHIELNNSPVIISSPIIFSLNQSVITNNVKLIDVKHYSINETYPWQGAHSTAINKCSGAQIQLNQNKLKYELDVRVFNDGVAFRTIIPDNITAVNTPDESTVFTLPAGAIIWYHDLQMHYEGVHVKKEISQVQQGEWVAPPATVKLPGNYYVSITEADLKNYGGMVLQANGKNGLVIKLPQHQPTSYPYRLRYSAEDTARLLQPAAIKGTITTPWRVMMIGKDLNAIVNNDMIHNLCEQPDKKLFPEGIHTDWIRPGRAVWKYLDGGGDGTPEVMKKFTDEAAALGFEHNILEGFWQKWTDDQLKDLVDYSKQKNVGIWLWKHSKELRDSSERIAFFQHCHALGITGVKLDFFDHEAKEVIDLYQSILKETAEYHLLVDFHGANKPTGLSRTYPNELTCEAVKGMEASKLAERATHETTIPFTRLLAGPAEYTVLLFGDRRKNTTWAHQVASAAILSAPLLTYAANPATILSNPAADIIKNIPAVWDETIVLPGSAIGELAAYARRKGNNWFIAVMNGVQPAHIKIPLTFLKQTNYKAMIVKDDATNAASVITEHATYTSKDAIELSLTSGGGFIAQLTP